MTEVRFVRMPRHDAIDAADHAYALWHDRLTTVLPQAVSVEHVGATAVPGCDTKGDLDIAVRVASEDSATTEATRAALLDRNMGSGHMESFAAFKDDTVQPPIGVQLVVLGSPLDVFVRFRDLLRADPGLVACYNALKRECNGAGMDAYRAAKSAFIETALTGVAKLPGSEARRES